MTRRRILLILAVVLVAAIFAVVVWPTEKEPEYKGRRLSEWIRIYDNRSLPDMKREEARQAVCAIGTNALPLLVKWVLSEPEMPMWRVRLLYFYNNKVPAVFRTKAGVRLISGSSVFTPMKGATGFTMLRREGRSALPELAEAIDTTNVNRLVLLSACFRAMGEDLNKVRRQSPVEWRNQIMREEKLWAENRRITQQTAQEESEKLSGH